MPSESSMDIPKLRKLHAAGLTDAELALRLGCSSSLVEKWRQRLGLVKLNPWTPAVKARLVEIYKQHNAKAVATILNREFKTMFSKNAVISQAGRIPGLKLAPDEITRRKTRAGRRSGELKATAKGGDTTPPRDTLSPAMRHLAQFDSVIAARLRLEQKNGEGQ